MYAENWEEISAAIIKRSRGRCECVGECGLHRKRRCVERNKTKAKWARGRVVLTTHHLDYNKTNNTWTNLKAMCNRCHLRCDAPMRAERRKLAQDKRARQERFWPLPEHP